MFPSYNLRVKKLYENATLPKKAHKNDVGFDLFPLNRATINSGKTVKIPTGIATIPPHGYFLQLFSRSSLGSKGIILSTGTIDPEYRGEIFVCLTNTTPYDYEYDPETAIAQMIPLPFDLHEVVEIENLEETERGIKGFGSSDVSNKKPRLDLPEDGEIIEKSCDSESTQE